MSAAQHDTTGIQPALRRRLLLQLALILISTLLLGSSYFWFNAARDAQTQTLESGSKLMRQAAVLLQPLLLADDRVSLNYLINELGNQAEIRGIALYDQTNELVARSGDSEGPLEQELLLERERQSLGRMLFWLDPEPALQQRLAQLYLVAGFWLAGTLMALVVMGTAMSTRRTAAKEQASEEEPEQVQEDAAITETVETENPDTVTEPALEQHEERTDDEDWEDEESPEQEYQQDPGPGKAAREEAGFEGLLDLLRPVKERMMPRFRPSAPQSPDEAEFHPESRLVEETVEFDDEDDVPTIQPNPLRGRTEQQLGLYSFEHELELALAPEDAIYLLLIDAASGHADYVEEEERDALLEHYAQHATQIAAIYNGETERQDNGDIRIWFLAPTDEDAHGANALCAAKLFTMRYRAFNQSRIRNFLPVLNLHISLVRGQRDKAQFLLEEAQFLTRSTQSNELISHTALTEAPDLKASLLDSADIRREDEDKVLIYRLSDAYEELLQKQTTHLISKNT